MTSSSSESCRVDPYQNQCGPSTGVPQVLAKPRAPLYRPATSLVPANKVCAGATGGSTWFQRPPKQQLNPQHSQPRQPQNQSGPHNRSHHSAPLLKPRPSTKLEAPATACCRRACLTDSCACSVGLGFFFAAIASCYDKTWPDGTFHEQRPSKTTGTRRMAAITNLSSKRVATFPA